MQNEINEIEITNQEQTEQEEKKELDINKTLEIIEAVLYAAGHPVTYDKLADILETTPSKAKEIVSYYEEKYNNSELPRGVQLIMFDKACQLCTKSEYESYVKLALGIKQGRGKICSSLRHPCNGNSVLSHIHRSFKG